MNATKIPIFILQARNRARGEQINIGVAALSPWGARVIFEVDRARLRAVDADRAAMHENAAQADALGQMLEHLREPALQMEYLRPLGTPGMLVVADEQDLDRSLEQLLAREVRPARATIRPKREPSPSTRLQKQLRIWLRSAKVFSTRADDIIRGRVVPNYPISLGEELFADFALQNGALHVIEALDLRQVERLSKGMRNEAGFKALLLDQVKAMDSRSDRVAVFAADDYQAIKPAWSMMQRYASAVFAYESAADRQELADLVARRLHRQGMPQLIAE